VSDFADELIHLKNTGSWSGGGTPSKANPAYWEGGTIPWVSPKDMKTFEIVDSQDKITPEAIADSPVRLVPAGSILMVVRSGILAHTFPVAIANTDVTLNQDMKAIIPREDIVPKFLAYQLISQSNTILTNCTKTGTTVSSVETKLLQSLQVWIPVEAKQEAIVADLDKQLSRLDETTSTLQAIQAKLKQARASILKAAVEGRLVETEAELARQSGFTIEDAEALLARCLEAKKKSFEDQAAGRKITKRWKSPPAPTLPLAFPLPEGWVLVSMEQIADVSGGLAKDSKVSDGETLPYLRVANVQRGRLDLAEVKSIICPSERIESLLLQKGDVLLNEGGDRDKLGRGWVWNNQIERCIHQNHVFKARLACKDIQPKFISHYANMEGGRYFQQEGKQTTNLASISLSKVRSLPIALPPAAEQVRILAEVDRRFSVLDQVEATVNASLKRCGQLRQAVLKRAFGE
jgi:type I restriction enzyme S subunit